MSSIFSDISRKKKQQKKKLENGRIEYYKINGFLCLPLYRSIEAIFEMQIFFFLLQITDMSSYQECVGIAIFRGRFKGRFVLNIALVS